MGWFSKKQEEQTVTVSNDDLDQTIAELEAYGYDVCGEATKKGGKTEISYRPDPDKKRK